MIKVIIFDFDGVIVDSPQMKHEAWFQVFAAEPPHIRAAFERVVPFLRNEPRFHIARRIAEELALPPQESEPFIAKYIAAYGKIVHEGIIGRGCMPGVLETLDNLSRRLPLYLNSGTPEEPLLLLTRDLDIGRYFRGIYGRPRGDVGLVDAKVDNLKQIQAKEKTEPDEMVMVGDANADYEAAQTFGCRFVGVANSVNKWDENMPFDVIRNFDELEKLIDECE